MKRQLIYLLLVLVAVASMAFACKKAETESTETTSTAMTETSTTTTSVTDTSGTTTTDTAATATAPVTNLDPKDKEFFDKAAVGGMFEVQAGQMAAQKAQSADVKEFGNRMVTDHSKANDELKQLAATKGLTVPAELDQEKKGMVDHLNGLTGKEFDKAYMSHMVDDHNKDVKEFETESKDAKDLDLKNWAAKTLPTLQEHQKLAKATQKKVK